MTQTNGAAAALSKAERKLKHLQTRQKIAEAKIRLARLDRQAKAEELRASHWWPRAERNPGTELLREALQAKGRGHADLLEQAKAHGKELTEGNFLWDWVSGYQDLIDRLRSPDGLLLSAISVAADRRYGAYWPFFRTWNDLALLRGASRILFQTCGLARGAVSGLTSYIIGEGSTTRAAPKKDCPLGLAEAVQDVLDENCKVNGWAGLEQEALRRDVRDGEWYLRDFAQDSGLTLTRTVGPEQLIQPANSSLEEWSFGKKNPIGEQHDVQTVLAYHVCYDGDNTHGAIVSAEEMYGHTCNVDRDVKRGIPDLAYDVYDFLKVASRLIENMGEGSAIQAAIAQIRQWDAPVAADQATDFADSEADYTQTNPWTGSTQNVRQIRPGTIEDIPKGMTYVPPPFAQGSSAYIEVEQAVLRAVAVTWNAPEWLTSGDASNNNYASSLTAESPFIKYCLRRQGEYKTCFTEARWRALRNYCEAKGGITANGSKYSFADVQKYVDIQLEYPSAEVRNRLEEAQANSIRVQGRWKSPQTVCQEEGGDWEQELANMEEFDAQMGQQGPPLPDDLGGDAGGDLGGGNSPTTTGDTSLRATVGGLNAIASLQSDYYAGKVPREAAVANARLLFGFSPSEAAGLFPEIAPVKLTPDQTGAGGDLDEGMEQLLYEMRLEEEGFTGIDAHGHKWVNGKQVKRGQSSTGGARGRGQSGGAARGPVARAHAALTSQVAEKLAPDIRELQATLAGQETLKKSAALAEHVKAALAKGVKAAVEVADSELGGGLSIIAGGVKTQGKAAKAAAVAQGVSRALNSVFVCVHEEMFEMALAQHSLPGAHAVGMVAAKVAATAESAVLKGVAWAWAKVRGVGEGRYVLESADLTEADKALIAQLARVAAEAVRQVLAEAGVPDAEVDETAAAKRIAELLAG